MNHRQQGAALVVVLSLLTVSLMVGLSSMQSSQIDERLAGNYKAASEAQMAAEYGASKEFEGASDHNETWSCDEAAKYPDSSVGLEEWSSEKEVDSEVVFYRSLPCLDDNGSKVKLFMGYVKSGDEVVARRFLMVGDEASGEFSPSLPDGLFDYAILSAGPYSMNPASSVSGDAAMNVGMHNVPDPRSEHAADPTRTGYVDKVKEKVAERDKSVVESCDSDFSKGAAYIVFCSGVFESDVDSRLDGMVVVSDGRIGSGSGINVKGDVKASFISNGEIRFKGFGNNEISGLVWASGSISFAGRSNVVGSVVSNGAIGFNGKTVIRGDDGDDLLPGGGGGVVWESM